MRVLFLLGGLFWIGYSYWRQQRQIQHQKKNLPALATLPPLPEWPSLPLVSILVAAWNEEPYIAAFLDSFAALTYPQKELILCAGGDDHTYAMAQKWCNSHLTLLQQITGEGKYHALQRTLAHASGTIIFLTDADCILNDESFQRLIYPIISERETVVTGTFQPLASQQCYPFVVAQWLMEVAGRSQISCDPVYSNFVVGANCALARSTLEACWEVDLSNAIGEDYHLALQIQRRKERIRQCVQSSVQTRYPLKVFEYIRRKSRWHRSWLLHHYRQGDRRWVRNGLSALRFQLLLALPLLPLLLGPMAVVIWIVLWVRQFIPYWLRRQAVAKTAKMPHADKVQISHLFLLMLADFCTWAIIPFQLIIPRWRRQW